MPPKFNSSSFDFTNQNKIPKHVEGWPNISDQKPSKYWLKGMDMFDFTEYVLAINIDDIGTARLLYNARRKKLDRTQPNGGRLQDRVDIMYPDQTT